MTKKILIGVAVAAVVLLAGTALLVTGFAFGRGSSLLQGPLAMLRGADQDGAGRGTCGMMPFGGMLRGWGSERGRTFDRDGKSDGPFGRRMPGGTTQVPAPWAGMDGWGGSWSQPCDGSSCQGQAPFGGMMMRGYGMRGSTSAEPLSVAQARTAAETLLKETDLKDLAVAEVMIFDNHAYVEVKDSTTGKGALELLVDPVSKTAFLEFGPSMMWNTKYGMHSDSPLGFRGMGGMMGAGVTVPAGEPTVTAEQAVSLAQAYLDKSQAGATADTTAESFPGYFTLHVLQDGKVTGMLSVNGYTGQVWFHTWHGTLLEISE